jgi:hypothetical protein
VRIPIKATAREPIKQAGYISATSDTQHSPSCETQPVHTFGSNAEAGYMSSIRQLWADSVAKVFLHRSTQIFQTVGAAL